jgi:modulator of FtsH protease
MESWAGFFQASAGAGATLTGMLVVAISINLGRILDIPRLPDRAASALIPLAGVLIVSALALVPGQPPAWFGAEALVSGAVIWTLTGLMLIRSTPRKGGVLIALHLLISQAQSLPFVIGGVLTLIGVREGLYWMVPGVIAAFLGGMLNTWVLLVEILR